MCVCVCEKTSLQRELCNCMCIYYGDIEIDPFGEASICIQFQGRSRLFGCLGNSGLSRHC